MALENLVGKQIQEWCQQQKKLLNNPETELSEFWGTLLDSTYSIYFKVALHELVYYFSISDLQKDDTPFSLLQRYAVVFRGTLHRLHF
jgi:hypothetical protein